MSHEKEHNQGGKKGNDRTLSLKVGTPKGAFTAEFEKNAKVLDVIAAAIEVKELGGDPSDFEVYHGDQKLEPVTRTLISFGLKDGDELLVTAQGDGV